MHGNRKTKRHKRNSLADHFLNYWSCKNPLWLPDCKHQSLEPACKPAPEIVLSISVGLRGETCVWHQCRSLDVLQRGIAVPSQQLHSNELVTGWFQRAPVITVQSMSSCLRTALLTKGCFFLFSFSFLHPSLSHVESVLAAVYSVALKKASGYTVNTHARTCTHKYSMRHTTTNPPALRGRVRHAKHQRVRSPPTLRRGTPLKCSLAVFSAWHLSPVSLWS